MNTSPNLLPTGVQELTALRLLQLKAIKFQPQSPFTWGNGWKVPIYCDDRKILSYPKMCAFVKTELARTVMELYPDADVIAGIAVNAIAHGVLVAEQLGLPFVYVYPHPKDHGLENQIEGDLRPRQNVVVIENQVNTGDNCMRVIEALRNNGCKVLGVVTIFDYMFPSTARKFNYVAVPLTSLTDLGTTLQQALDMNLITKELQRSILSWQKHPSKWNK